jgi:ferric-dicitrate binding protein FerR (iron transport regulator)
LAFFSPRHQVEKFFSVRPAPAVHALLAVAEHHGSGAELTAGQRAVVSLTTNAPPVIETVTAAVAARLLAWQPQLLDFSSVPLELAILEFNRRNRVQFSLADAELAAMPIVATIRSDNVEGFAQFLTATPGIQVERRGDSLIVLRRTER